MYQSIQKLVYKIVGVVIITTMSFHAIGQDTLAGNYPTLTLKSGLHIIKETVTVKGKLEIQAGAKIEISDPGIIVCEGEVNINGDKNNKIEARVTSVQCCPCYIIIYK